eukprot:333615_1
MTTSDTFLQVKHAPAIKILVLDGGGLRGCMSTEILSHLEAAVREDAKKQGLPKADQIKLGDVFDMLVGTSTGGLIALGLGKGKMDCATIQTMYNDVAEKVFAPNWAESLFNSASAYTTGKAQFSTDKLETIIKEKFPEDLNMIERGDRKADWKKEPFLFVMTVLTNNYLNPVPVLLRNYDITTDRGFNEFAINGNFDLPGLNEIKVWEAARCTTAAPLYFEPKTVDMPTELISRIKERKICKLLGFDTQNMIKQEELIVNDIIKNIDNAIKEYPSDINSWSATRAFKKHIYDPKKKKIKELIKSINDKRKSDVKEIQYDMFVDKIYRFWDMKEVQFKDGGVSTNAPCLFAYTEARRLWPNSDIKMLAVGTSKAPQTEIYDTIATPKLYVSRLFEVMFRGKELTTLVPLMSFAEQSKNSFDLSRWNPEFDPKETEMSDTSKMKDWIDAGTKYAKSKAKKIQKWAEFLVNEKKKKTREEVVRLFQEKQRERKNKLRSKL